MWSNFPRDPAKRAKKSSVSQPIEKMERTKLGVADPCGLRPFNLVGLRSRSRPSAVRAPITCNALRAATPFPSPARNVNSGALVDRTLSRKSDNRDRPRRSALFRRRFGGYNPRREAWHAETCFAPTQAASWLARRRSSFHFIQRCCLSARSNALACYHRRAKGASGSALPRRPPPPS